VMMCTPESRAEGILAWEGGGALAAVAAAVAVAVTKEHSSSVRFSSFLSRRAAQSQLVHPD